MSAHEDSSLEKRRRNHGRKLPYHGLRPAHLGDSTLDWELDEGGRPRWIASWDDALWGRWATIIGASATADSSRHLTEEALAKARPAAMPSVGARLGNILRPDTHPAKAVGRPPVYKDDPLACRWAAWMSDIRGVSTWELSRRLRASVARDERTVRKTAEARLRAGRIMLSRQGILPWVLWPAGVLPDGWWAENRFQDGLRAWYEVYVVAMKPAVEQAKRQLRTGESGYAAAAAFVIELRQLTRDPTDRASGTSLSI